MPSRTHGDVPNVIACERNLKVFAHYLELYSNSHSGSYPDSLQTLILQCPQPIPSSLFVCAGSNADPAPETSRSELAASIVNNPERFVSYVYVRTGVNHRSNPNCVLVYEPLHNHHGEWMNILFLDGHIERWESSRAEKLIAELQAGHNPPRPEMVK